MPTCRHSKARPKPDRLRECPLSWRLEDDAEQYAAQHSIDTGCRTLFVNASYALNNLNPAGSSSGTAGHAQLLPYKPAVARANSPTRSTAAEQVRPGGHSACNEVQPRLAPCDCLGVTRKQAECVQSSNLKPSSSNRETHASTTTGSNRVAFPALISPNATSIPRAAR